MLKKDLFNLSIEKKAIQSSFLKREVVLDLYIPAGITDFSMLSLLLINDGQNLDEMKFPLMLDQLWDSNQIHYFITAGIHAGADRKNEYGTSGTIDYEGRGTKSKEYQQFILHELLPFIHLHFGIKAFKETAVAGFSLGGLSALDLVWNYSGVFSTAGVFSGSLWWRSKALDKGYNEDTDRIMHQNIRKGHYHPGLRFFFTTGSLDETADRNNNGIIDSVDDTLSLIEELRKKGYNTEYDIKYINFENGRHDIATWGKAMPLFLLWWMGRGMKN